MVAFHVTIEYFVHCPYFTLSLFFNPNFTQISNKKYSQKIDSLAEWGIGSGGVVQGRLYGGAKNATV